MKIRLFVIVFFCVSLFSLTYFSPPYGIEAPTAIDAYLNGVFPEKSPANSSWKLVEAFPGITFTDPLAMEEVPSKNGFYVAGKSGQIWFVEHGDNTKKLVLDISNQTIISGDAGLINFILHPEFGQEDSPNNAYLYIFYAYHPSDREGEDERVNRLSRFEVFPNSTIIDPESEYILIQDYDPHEFHMGGGMAFDENGFFYMSWGDGGGSLDTFDSSQQISERFWGGIIRLDLDNKVSKSHEPIRSIREYQDKPSQLPSTYTQGYSIPNDNPFNNPNGSNLEEFYALGFRSPHRISYDLERKELWVSDVGHGSREEITVVKKGGNAQWPYREGKTEGIKPRPETIIGFENPPVFDYSRSEGNAVIGGFVYRGEKWKEQLEGLYIFGDHGSRNVWLLNPLTSEVEYIANVPGFGSGNKNGISSFGTDKLGNVYILKLYGKDQDGGVIYKLELNEEEPPDIPELLSETGVFQDLENLVTSPGIIPYRTNAPLWSDGAIKQRWIAVPNDGVHNSQEEKIDFFDDSHWVFPSGTVLIKHFSMPIDERNPTILKKLETRFYIMDKEGVGYGLSYQWNEDESDAFLMDKSEIRWLDVLNEDGENYTKKWEYPSRQQCNTCHTSNAGFMLGVNTWQLNGDLEYKGSGIVSNQLETWNHLGMFSEQLTDDAISTMSKAVSLDDPQANLQEKVFSYIASNCSSCHRPDGVEGIFDARFDTPASHKNLIGIKGKSHNTPDGEKIVVPGVPESSHMWIRDNSVGTDKMPPIAKSTIDEDWIEVLTAWIKGLNEPCFGTYLSDIEWKRWAQNGLGKVERDQSNGGEDTDDGLPISIAGKTFRKGLGVYGFSEIIYNLNSEYNYFSSSLGVDDSACAEASVVFTVLDDEKVLYRSSVMRLGDSAIPVTLDISGVDKLKLIVTNGGDGDACDIASWGDARVHVDIDSDQDGVCDQYDICPGADDQLDQNGDGIPDGCEDVIVGGTLEIEIIGNPFVNTFKIRLLNPDFYISRASILIYDLNGRLFFEKHNMLLDTAYEFGQDLPIGRYVIHAKAGAFVGNEIVIKF